jgi:hypothetical protein
VIRHSIFNCERRPGLVMGRLIARLRVTSCIRQEASLLIFH